MAKKAAASSATALKLEPILRKQITLTIRGFGGPLVQHAWAEKALTMMRDKHAGIKTKNRDIRDPAAEAEAACYKTADGKYGVSLLALKKAILMAAHKDLGIERTMAARAIFIVPIDSGTVVPFIDQKKYEVGEDHVRVGQGSADLRYRPYWAEWAVRVTFELDSTLLETKAFCTLVEWAGSRVGIGEMRPEKSGGYGRFKIDFDAEVLEKVVQ